MWLHNLIILGVITNANLVELVVHLTCDWMCEFKPCGEQNLFSFCQISFGMKVKRFGKPSSQGGSRGCWKMYWEGY